VLKYRHFDVEIKHVRVDGYIQGLYRDRSDYIDDYMVSLAVEEML